MSKTKFVPTPEHINRAVTALKRGETRSECCPIAQLFRDLTGRNDVQAGSDTLYFVGLRREDGAALRFPLPEEATRFVELFDRVSGMVYLDSEQEEDPEAEEAARSIQPVEFDFDFDVLAVVREAERAQRDNEPYYAVRGQDGGGA